MLKYFKQVTTVVVAIYLLGAAVLAPYFFAKWSDSEVIVAQQQEELITAVAIIEKLNDTKQKIISCASNQKDYIKLTLKEERKYNMPRGILQNVIYHESRWNPDAVSHKGAQGIIQLHPRWHKSVNPYDPYEAIPYGAKYLKSLYDRFQDWELALAAWNWGQGNLSKYTFHKAPKETRDFVRNVMKGVHVT